MYDTMLYYTPYDKVKIYFWLDKHQLKKKKDICKDFCNKAIDYKGLIIQYKISFFF